MNFLKSSETELDQAYLELEEKIDLNQANKNLNFMASVGSFLTEIEVTKKDIASMWDFTFSVMMLRHFTELTDENVDKIVASDRNQFKVDIVMSLLGYAKGMQNEIGKNLMNAAGYSVFKDEFKTKSYIHCFPYESDINALVSRSKNYFSFYSKCNGSNLVYSPNKDNIIVAKYIQMLSLLGGPLFERIRPDYSMVDLTVSRQLMPSEANEFISLYNEIRPNTSIREKKEDITGFVYLIDQIMRVNTPYIENIIGEFRKSGYLLDDSLKQIFSSIMTTRDVSEFLQKVKESGHATFSPTVRNLSLEQEIINPLLLQVLINSDTK